MVVIGVMLEKRCVEVDVASCLSSWFLHMFCQQKWLLGKRCGKRGEALTGETWTEALSLSLRTVELMEDIMSEQVCEWLVVESMASGLFFVE